MTTQTTTQIDFPNAGILTFLFGPIYLLIRQAYLAAGICLVLNFVGFFIFGLGNLVMPFFARRMVEEAAIKRAEDELIRKRRVAEIKAESYPS